MKRVSILLVALGISCHVSKADLIGLYEFNGSGSAALANSYGSLPSLTEQINGGSAGASGGSWTWSSATAPGDGLVLSTGAMSTYSIGVIFQYSDVTAYRKVVDFANQAQEWGLYVVGTPFLSPTGFQAFNDLTNPSGGSVSASTTTTVVMTRDGSGNLNIYQNNSSTPIITLADTQGRFVASSSLRFFLDDNNGGEFSAAGSVDEIRVWNTALSAAEIPDAFAPIPEPVGTTALIGAGVAVIALSRRRKRQ